MAKQVAKNAIRKSLAEESSNLSEELNNLLK